MPNPCSFCSKPVDQVTRIVTGPHVHICNECVHVCGEILEEDSAAVPGWGFDVEARCSFCGRTADQLDHIFAKQGAKAKICSECFSSTQYPEDSQDSPFPPVHRPLPARPAHQTLKPLSNQA